MRTIELFCGTKSFSKVMAARGHDTFTVDIEPSFRPDLVADLTRQDVVAPYVPDIIWASPPCTTFSVASIGTHWTGGKRAYVPRTERAKDAIQLIRNTVSLVCGGPGWWFIENPRGVLRKLGLIPGRRVTVTYCQYGDTRMKPTDIWTNADWWHPRPVCRNGDPCHERAPRGAKTGTQGLGGAVERGRIPPALFEEILSHLTSHNE